MNKQSDKPWKPQIRGSTEEKKSNVANSLRTVAVENMEKKHTKFIGHLMRKRKLQYPVAMG